MSERSFFDGRAVMHHGDSRDVLRSIPDASIDSIVTDPPYALVSIVKRFGAVNAAPAKAAHGGGAYARASAGFMGQAWDTGETAFAVEFWAEVFRVLKPGGHVVAFSGTRTYHRLAVAIEDAGFEIRDQLGWLYGTGFPKSHDVGKAIPERRGWGTALKPAWEPIGLARKPLIGTVAENVLAHGTGAINIAACRVPRADTVPIFRRRGEASANVYGDGLNGSNRTGEVAIGGFPANVLHDGSDEVEAAFSEFGERTTNPKTQAGYVRDGAVYGVMKADSGGLYAGSSGSASRFFYCAKASKRDRAGSKHPTVKPVALMRWLARLVTPPGGVILEPFAGSGTTLQAAIEEGFRVIGIERELPFFADCCARLGRHSGERPADLPQKARKPRSTLALPPKPTPIVPFPAVIQPCFFEVA